VTIEHFAPILARLVSSSDVQSAVHDSDKYCFTLHAIVSAVNSLTPSQSERHLGGPCRRRWAPNRAEISARRKAYTRR